MHQLVKTNSRATCSYKVNISVKNSWLRVLTSKLTARLQRRKNPPNRVNMENDTAFQALLKSDANNPLIISWLNEAKLRNKTRPKPSTEHLYDLWCERNEHFQQIGEKALLVEKQKEKNVSGPITASARLHLSICAIALNLYGILYLQDNPEYKIQLIKAAVLCNTGLCLVYLLRYRIGRGPDVNTSLVAWVFKQLGVALVLGFGVGLFFGALILIRFGYLSLADDGLGGLWNLLKIFLANEIP